MERLLFVDDEPNVLDGIRRQLRKRANIETATSGEAALQLIEQSEPFTVIVSDMRMPGMNGAEFLAQARELSPDSVRMILSGQAELESTIDAVNNGHIFRFLTKPCDGDKLWQAIETGIEQYRLIKAERELLEQTLSGAVQVLTDMLAMTNPAAYRRATEVQQYTEALARGLPIAGQWQFRLAAMLSQIGCITLPESLLARLGAPEQLNDEERALYRSHPAVAERLLARIPRLEPVAAIVAAQLDDDWLQAHGQDPSQWPAEALSAACIRAAADFAALLAQQLRPAAAVQSLRKAGQLPDFLLDALLRINVRGGDVEARQVVVTDLLPGMVLDQDVMSRKGIRLVPRGQEVTKSLLERLHTIAEGVGIQEPIDVLVPVSRSHGGVERAAGEN